MLTHSWSITDVLYCFFFFNDTATTEIYTLSLHDALPICAAHAAVRGDPREPYTVIARRDVGEGHAGVVADRDRKSTRLNSSHQIISYAVFCLKKKKTNSTLINISFKYIYLLFVIS